MNLPVCTRRSGRRCALHTWFLLAFSLALVPARADAQERAHSAVQDRTPRELDALIAEALERRPDLDATRHAVEAAEEVPSRAGTLPDPRFEFSVSNFRFDDPGLNSSPMSGLQFGLVQAFPFPGTLGARADAARARIRVAEREVQDTEVRSALLVRSSYWDLWLAERAEVILTQNEQVLDNLANAVHARFGVGQGAQQDALQVEVAHSTVRSRLIEQRQSVVTAARALERSVGLEPDGTTATVNTPAEIPALDRQALRRRLRRENPAVLTSRARVTAAERAAAAAEWDRAPIFFVGAAYRLRGEVAGDPSQGADMFSVTVGTTLPIFLARSQSARVRELEQRAAEAESRAEDVALEAQLALDRTLDTIERIEAQITLYREELLPETDQALDASVTDYQFGRVQLVSVLRNWRDDLSARLEFERLRAQRAQAHAYADALLGWRGEDTP